MTSCEIAAVDQADAMLREWLDDETNTTFWLGVLSTMLWLGWEPRDAESLRIAALAIMRRGYRVLGWEPPVGLMDAVADRVSRKEQA